MRTKPLSSSPAEIRSQKNDAPIALETTKTQTFAQSFFTYSGARFLYDTIRWAFTFNAGTSYYPEDNTPNNSTTPVQPDINSTFSANPPPETSSELSMELPPPMLTPQEMSSAPPIALDATLLAHHYPEPPFPIPGPFPTDPPLPVPFPEAFPQLACAAVSIDPVPFPWEPHLTIETPPQPTITSA
jgi:hypothetical protein